jgi:hypothetical protein
MKRLQKGNVNTKEHWTEEYNKTGPGIAKTQAFRYEIISNYISDVDCTVVDLGCGTGVCDLFIKGSKPKARITGVDLSDIGKDLKMENNDNSEVIETVETNEGFAAVLTPAQEIQEIKNSLVSKLEAVQIDILRLTKAAESLFSDNQISNSLSMRISNGKIVENYSLFLEALRGQENVIQALTTPKKETKVNE